MRWFTADHHFGHSNIIKYCDRPYSSVGEMEKDLVTKWNENVKEDDIVYHLGDFCWYPPMERYVVKQLNGNLIIVLGNHDRRKRVLRLGIPCVEEAAIKLAEETVILNHYPYKDDTLSGDRFSARRPVDTGKWLLHGHIHDTWKVRDKMINVGVDVWGYRPVSQEEIIQIIQGGSNDTKPVT